jgi:hypothetical protein
MYVITKCFCAAVCCEGMWTSCLQWCISHGLSLLIYVGLNVSLVFIGDSGLFPLIKQAFPILPGYCLKAMKHPARNFIFTLSSIGQLIMLFRFEVSWYICLRSSAYLWFMLYFKFVPCFSLCHLYHSYPQCKMRLTFNKTGLPDTTGLLLESHETPLLDLYLGGVLLNNFKAHQDWFLVVILW